MRVSSARSCGRGAASWACPQSLEEKGCSLRFAQQALHSRHLGPENGLPQLCNPEVASAGVYVRPVRGLGILQKALPKEIPDPAIEVRGIDPRKVSLPGLDFLHHAVPVGDPLGEYEEDSQLQGMERKEAVRIWRRRGHVGLPSPRSRTSGEIKSDDRRRVRFRALPTDVILTVLLLCLMWLGVERLEEAWPHMLIGNSAHRDLHCWYKALRGISRGRRASAHWRWLALARPLER